MKKKVLEIGYCIECPHCNGFFFCAKIGKKVDEIPEECPLQDAKAQDLDVTRLNFLEQQTRKSPTGISFDYAASMDGESGGYRFMRRHKLHNRMKTIRAAIDEAMLKEIAETHHNGYGVTTEHDLT